MTLALISKFLQWGLFVWFALLIMLVVGKLLSGTMSARGIISRTGNEISPQSAIAMGAFPIVLLFFVTDSLSLLEKISELGPDVRPSLPNIPDYLVALLAGSNGLYLADKLSQK